MKIRFYYCENEWLQNGFSRYDVYFSKKFCEFFSKKFEEEFFLVTGLMPSTKVALAGYKQDNDLPMYEPGLISKLNLVLWIMPEFNDNISFCWKSKSGQIVKTTDENFDEGDLECWFERLKPIVYWREVATEKKSHPFQIANLPYELQVFGFGVETILRIFFKDPLLINNVKATISTTIENYNQQSEADGRMLGLVHNHRFEEEYSHLAVHIDTGSAGINITKKLLKALSKEPSITKVEVDI